MDAGRVDDRAGTSLAELLDRLASPAGPTMVAHGGLPAVLAAHDSGDLADALGVRLVRTVAAAWDRGWQPIDLERFVARRTDGDVTGLLRVVLGEDADAYAARGRMVAPAWMGQLTALHVVPSAPGATADRLAAAVDGEDGPPVAGIVEDAVVLLVVLAGLFDLPRLVDPPSTWTDEAAGPVEAAPPSLLARIRALLAKAESTDFDAEAEAFTAKAQELMARHRVDRALLDDRQPVERLADGVVGRRVSIDDPYATAKFHLVSAIAEVNGVRAVWSKELGMATLMGFPVEVDVVEELFTSLLVQATTAMRREGSKVDRRGRSRTKAFRRSFLLAYADRVEHRLRAAVARIVDEVGNGTDLVPVLAERDDAVATRMKEVFPRLRSMSASVSDAEGVFAGRLAGDRADLSAGPRLDR